MLKIIILTIFTISGCASQRLSRVDHPDLITPTLKPLPKYTREMVNCGSTDGKLNSPDDLELCYRIKERETALKEYINDLLELIDMHNLLLSEPES